jgi:uncharacterized protein (DUF1697 family)
MPSMTTYIALLRGINLGPRNKIAMADLRGLLEGLGLEDVRTHILSGNTIFRSSRRSSARLATDIEQAIEKRFGFRVAVLIRTRVELAKVVEANPFPLVKRDPSRCFAMFLSENPERERIDRIDPGAVAPDEFLLGDRVIYTWLPKRLQGSKVFALLSDKALGVTTTNRSWNTTTKLLELAGS